MSFGIDTQFFEQVSVVFTYLNSATFIDIPMNKAVSPYYWASSLRKLPAQNKCHKKLILSPDVALLLFIAFNGFKS